MKLITNSICGLIPVFLILLIENRILDSINAQSPKLELNEPNMAEFYKEDVYIIDFRKNDNSKKPFTIKCSAFNSLDLNLTFTGLNSRFEKTSSDLINVSGKKELSIRYNSPLKSEYTGRYTCVARFENDIIVSSSWYIYFYPGDGSLFLKCPLMSQLPKCLVFYRVNIAFKIPCKTLHPDVVVDEQKNFEYKSEIGFSGKLSGDKRDFECVARFDGFFDSQKYDLNRKSLNTKIYIKPPDDMNLVPDQKDFLLTVSKDQSLNLTCFALVSCNDINYDITFRTNSSDDYKVIMNIPDRSRCLLNFNEMSNFTKSIIFSGIKTNGTKVQCEIKYGPELKTESPIYYLFYAEEPFIRIDPKNSIFVDYDGVTDSSSFLNIKILFQASGPFELDWLLNNAKIDLKSSNKFISNCVQTKIFDFDCFLNIDPYSKQDVGEYSAFIRLKSNNEIAYRLNAIVIMPKSPDTLILQPKFCSQDWTCELNRKIAVECNANAHKVDKILIQVQDCESYEECNTLKSNREFVNRLITDLEELSTDRLVDENDLIQIESESEYDSVVNEPDKGKTNLLFSNNENSIDTFDHGVTWSNKKTIIIKKFHLIFCYASNEIGNSYSVKIVIPSEIERGKQFAVDVINDRLIKDNEIVEGDNVRLAFLFNNILFNENEYNINAKPQDEPCGLNLKSKNEFNQNGVGLFDEKNNEYKYTKSVELAFKNIQLFCSFNYSLQLKLKKHQQSSIQDPSLTKPNNMVVNYNLNVLKSIKPYFLSIEKNKTIIESNGGEYLNETDTLLISNSDIKVESDRTIELNCNSGGRPKPIVTWIKDNKALNLTEEKFRLENNGSLKIFRIHSTDSGRYECNVSNRFGSLTRSFNVEVESAILTIKVKELTRRQIILITFISIAVFVLSILFLVALIYGLQKKREHSNLVKKHKRLIKFLSDGNDQDEIDEDQLINTKLENIEKLKFDDQKWEINPSNFIIHHDKVLGSGNFGKVCLATVSKTPLRDEAQVARDWNQDFNQLTNENSISTAPSRIMHRFSTKRPQNSYVGSAAKNLKNSSDIQQDESNQPLLNNKDTKITAAKMVKDHKVNSSNIDSLLQELKIMGYIGHHVNIIQLIGCYTAQLVSNGFAYVFVEYCPHGDLKNWLREHSHKYIKSENGSKTSMFYELKKRISSVSSRPISSKLDNLISNRRNSKTDANFSFNDNDLLFFGYQIAKGMEYLSRKRFLHRDLAARNILIGENFECKISDFGLADESKLTSQIYFGRVNTGMPIKWSPPEALLDLRYEANSDVWSFGIVLWELFTLCQFEPYRFILNKDFREYMAKIRKGEEEPELPENGSEETHKIIKSCWEIDHKQRPTFQQLVPIIESLLGDNYKKYYEILCEKFRQNLTETNLKFRKDTPSQIQSQTQTNNVKKTNSIPSYIKIPIDNTPVSTIENQNTGYLEPITINNPKTKQNENNGYLEPVLNLNPKQTSSSGYLEPNRKNLDDSYGGQLEENVSPDQDSYVNEDFVGELNNSNKKDAQFIDEEEGDERALSDTYLMPRLGSNVSSSTVNSTTSSTAPFQLPASKPNSNKKSTKFKYAPSPPLAKSKFSQLRSQFEKNETNV